LVTTRDATPGLSKRAHGANNRPEAP
jgi:hypothetical protein